MRLLRITHEFHFLSVSSLQPTKLYCFQLMLSLPSIKVFPCWSVVISHRESSRESWFLDFWLRIGLQVVKFVPNDLWLRLYMIPFPTHLCLESLRFQFQLSKFSFLPVLPATFLLSPLNHWNCFCIVPFLTSLFLVILELQFQPSNFSSRTVPSEVFLLNS